MKHLDNFGVKLEVGDIVISKPGAYYQPLKIGIVRKFGPSNECAYMELLHAQNHRVTKPVTGDPKLVQVGFFCIVVKKADGTVPEKYAAILGPVGDAYHTMGELYDHRRALTAALAAQPIMRAWKSKRHHPDDDPMFEGGYFIVGIDLPHAGTITYHYKLERWGDFANVREVEHAPKWDGALPHQTVIRLLDYAANLG